MTLYALALVLVFAGAALALTDAGAAPMPLAEFRVKRERALATTNVIVKRLCRPRIRFETRSYLIKPLRRYPNLRFQWERRDRARGWSSRCAPWPAWWYRQAMCIHRHEASWHNPTGIGPSVSGGMQIGDWEWARAGGLRYARRAYLATPFQQLVVAYRYWRLTGSDWGAWPNTARICGLPTS